MGKLIMKRGVLIPMNSDGTLTCSDCGESKPYTNQYFPYQIKKEGKLLKRCKSCQLIRTKEYYKNNPNYFKEYREDNWETSMKDYILNWMKINNAAKYKCKIYSITSPDERVYIGLTKRKTIKFRFLEHKKCFSAGIVKIRALCESFDKWGVENHKLQLIEELDTTDRNLGRKLESKWIKHYKNLGKSLNIQK